MGAYTISFIKKIKSICKSIFWQNNPNIFFKINNKFKLVSIKYMGKKQVINIAKAIK